jgi:hypothetical protein
MGKRLSRGAKKIFFRGRDSRGERNASLLGKMRLVSALAAIDERR